VAVARVSGLVAGVVLSFVVAGPAGGQNPPPTNLKIGFPQALFKDVPTPLIEAAAKPFQSMLHKTAGVNGTMEVVPDYKALAAGLKEGRLDLAVFHGFEYAWVRDMPELVPIVVTVPNCGKVQACLVVNYESKALTPKDLKGACVAVPKGSKAHCQMYLDWVREHEGVPAGDCCPIKGTGLSAEEVLDEVVNGKFDAALVDISALVAYELNKPGCFSCLKVLRKSDPLPPAVVVHRKGALTAQQVAAMRDGLLNCNKTPAGKTFTMFWNLKGFADVSAEYAAALDRCLKAYPPPALPAAPPAPPKKSP
jgi:ABC-type phosphate/phosphonate transport system substrate-binding protein